MQKLKHGKVLAEYLSQVVGQAAGVYEAGWLSTDLRFLPQCGIFKDLFCGGNASGRFKACFLTRLLIVLANTLAHDACHKGVAAGSSIEVLIKSAPFSMARKRPCGCVLPFSGPRFQGFQVCCSTYDPSYPRMAAAALSYYRPGNGAAAGPYLFHRLLALRTRHTPFSIMCGKVWAAGNPPPRPLSSPHLRATSLYGCYECRIYANGRYRAIGVSVQNGYVFCKQSSAPGSVAFSVSNQYKYCVSCP